MALAVGCATAVDGTEGLSTPSPVTASSQPSSSAPASASPKASFAAETRFNGRIALRGLRGDEPLALLVVDGRDGTVERVTNDDVYPDEGLSWSPDGRSIAFSRDVCPPDPCAVVISVVDLTDGTVRNITPVTAGVSDSQPSWSPDGLRIAFTSNRAAAGDPFRIDVYTIGVNGSELTRIPLDTTHAAQPAWSPDGRWIAFERSNGVQTDLAIVRPDGTAERSVIVDLGGSIDTAWSPDGLALAYSASGEAHEVAPAQFESLIEIRTVAVDGSGQRAVISYPMQGGSPVWSPDGVSIAFIGGMRGEPDRVWLVDADGSKPRVVALTDVYLGGGLAWTGTAGH